MLFCPTCSNILLTEKTIDGDFQFFCKTCPYTFKVENKIEYKMKLERKEVDDVLGGPDAWKDAAKTKTRCPECKNEEAYFFSIQIRSADEPETTYYKCTNTDCEFRWNENV